jgi:hypothetical protein
MDKIAKCSEHFNFINKKVRESGPVQLVESVDHLLAELRTMEAVRQLSSDDCAQRNQTLSSVLNEMICTLDSESFKKRYKLLFESFPNLEQETRSFIKLLELDRPT